MDLTQLQPGDLIGFAGHGLLSSSIQILTGSFPGFGLSHIAFVSEHTDNVGLYVFESTESFAGDVPCRITGRTHDGVRAAYPEDLAARPGRKWVYRPRITPSPYARYRLAQFAATRLGYRYDLRGAIKAGSTPLRWLLRKMFPDDASALFCSEFCAAAYNYSGLAEIVDPSSFSPNSLVRYTKRHAITLAPQELICGMPTR